MGTIVKTCLITTSKLYKWMNVWMNESLESDQPRCYFVNAPLVVWGLISKPGHQEISQMHSKCKPSASREEKKERKKRKEKTLDALKSFTQN